jgi:Concanavalin A-like lectin/glucanases superfamily
MAASTVASPAAPKTYDATVLADRPAAYWRMDETSGTTMTDASGNHNDGVYAGAYSLGQPAPFGGAGNLAVSFDGQKGGSASVPSAPSLQMSTITIELWMKKRTDTEYGVYVAKSQFQLLNNRHTGALEFRVTPAAEPALVSSSTLALNTWYHVVATYDGRMARLFVNGKADGTLAVVDTSSQAANPLTVGRRWDGLYADAVLDEIAIYPAALSGDRISAHWSAATRMR